MKIKTISRAKADYVKEKEGDVDKIHHNIDAKYHPFQQQREVFNLRLRNCVSTRVRLML